MKLQIVDDDGNVIETMEDIEAAIRHDVEGFKDNVTDWIFRVIEEQE